MNENTYSINTVVLQPNFDTSIQSQLNSALYASVGANDVESYGFDKSTNHNGNTFGKYNEDSQSYETTQIKKRSYSFGDTITTTTTPRSSTLPPHRK